MELVLQNTNTKKEVKKKVKELSRMIEKTNLMAEEILKGQAEVKDQKTKVDVREIETQTHDSENGKKVETKNISTQTGEDSDFGTEELKARLGSGP